MPAKGSWLHLRYVRMDLTKWTIAAAAMLQMARLFPTFSATKNKRRRVVVAGEGLRHDRCPLIGIVHVTGPDPKPP